jgi:hypothetical protein
MHTGPVTRDHQREVPTCYVVGLTTAVGIFRLQSPLERWHYDRHSYE